MSPKADPAPVNLELVALEETAVSLKASIAARDAVVGQSDEHRRATDGERARLREIESRISEIKPASK